MSGPTPLDGGSLHVPAQFTPILLDVLRQAIQAGSPLPEVRQLFEACGTAARESRAAAVRACPAATPTVLAPTQPRPPSDHEVGTAEASQRLGISGQRVRQLCTSGRLAGRRAARCWWITPESIETYAKERDGGI